MQNQGLPAEYFTLRSGGIVLRPVAILSAFSMASAAGRDALARRLGFVHHFSHQVPHVIRHALDDAKGLLEYVADDIRDGYSQIVRDTSDVFREILGDARMQNALFPSPSMPAAAPPRFGLRSFAHSIRGFVAYHHVTHCTTT